MFRLYKWCDHTNHTTQRKWRKSRMQWFGLEHTLQVFFSPKALPAPCLKQGWGTAWALCSCPGAGAVVGALETLPRDRMVSWNLRTLAPAWIICDKSTFLIHFSAFSSAYADLWAFHSLSCPLTVPVVFPCQHCHMFTPSLWAHCTKFISAHQKSINLAQICKDISTPGYQT